MLTRRVTCWARLRLIVFFWGKQGQQIKKLWIQKKMLKICAIFISCKIHWPPACCSLYAHPGFSHQLPANELPVTGGQLKQHLKVRSYWKTSHWTGPICFHQCWRLYVCNLFDSVQQQECSLLSGKNIEIFQQKQNNYTMMGPVNRSNWNRVFKENGLWGGFKGIVVDFSFEGFVVDFEEIVQYYYCGTLSVGGLLRSLLGKTICTWALSNPSSSSFYR